MKLSPIMQEALEQARAHGGKLERWEGGWWTYAGCPARMSSGHLTPDYSATWGTIEALLKRGMVRVSRSSKPDGQGYVVEVEIVGEK